MTEFLGDDYLITSPEGKDLFTAIRDLPLIDAHNHADVAEIAHNAPYDDIWQVEGATDHYVWSLLRKCGIAEHVITGNETSNREKWQAAAAHWDQLAGNPTYEWVYLDLKRTLGINDVINADNAETIWAQARQVLQRDDMRPQALVQRMNVEAMCSTDDPVDSLEFHRALASSPIRGVIRPTFRPDRAIAIQKPDWRTYVTRLEERVNRQFNHVHDMIDGLRTCHDFFAENGCVASDHGVTIPYGYAVSPEDANTAFKKAYSNRPLTQNEAIGYMAYMLNEMAQLDSEKGWVFQLHIGPVRNVRNHIAKTVGPDSGVDISTHAIDIVDPLQDLLNRFDGRLKVVLYCLHPGHQPTLTTLSRAFGNTVHLGAAWWFNDTPYGMKQQLEYVSGVDLLMNHAGMVSDSRKLLSYASRHEMFRRTLADVVGTMVRQGRLPMRAAVPLVEAVAYHNPKHIFGL